MHHMSSTTDTDAESEFWRLCDIVNQADTIEAGAPDLEPHLLEILCFVKKHPQHKELFVRCFIELATGPRNWTEWIILFCMRELRYVEVQRAINEKFQMLGGPNTGRGANLMNFVSHVNWVYDDAPWEDAVFFKYYWEKEHPNEPWPITDGNANA